VLRKKDRSLRHDCDKATPSAWYKEENTIGSSHLTEKKLHVRKSLKMTWRLERGSAQRRQMRSVVAM